MTEGEGPLHQTFIIEVIIEVWYATVTQIRSLLVAIVSSGNG